MKKLLILFAALLIQATLFAQAPKAEDDFINLPDKPIKKKKDKDQIYTIVEQMPQYPGGDDALLKFLSKNIKYPEHARDSNTMGTIFISFIIDKKGKVGYAQVLRGITGPGAKDCADEAIRVVKMMPKWKPGMQNGKKVAVQYNLPIKFTLR
jgi:periplasmic protein TonB